MNILDLITPYLTGKGAPVMQAPPPTSMSVPNMILARQGLNSMPPTQLPLGLSDPTAAAAGYTVRAAPMVAPSAAVAGGGAATGEGILAQLLRGLTMQPSAYGMGVIPTVSRFASRSIIPLAAMIAGRGISNAAGDTEVAQRQEAEAGESADVARRALFEMQKRVAEGLPPVDTAGTPPRSQQVPAVRKAEVVTPEVTPATNTAVPLDKWARMARLDNKLMGRTRDPKALQVLRSRYYEKMAGDFTPDQLSAFVKDGIAGVKEDDKMSDLDRTLRSAAFAAYREAAGEIRAETTKAGTETARLMKDRKRAYKEMDLNYRWGRQATPEEIAVEVSKRYPRAGKTLTQEDIQAVLGPLLQILGPNGSIDLSKLPTAGGAGREMVFPDGTRRFVPAKDITRAAAMGGK